MDDAWYLLSEFDANWVINNAGQKDRDRRESVRTIGPQTIICKNSASAIAGRSGSSISGAACTVYKVDAGVLTSLGRSVSVYNISTTTISIDSWIIAFLAGNTWLADPPSGSGSAVVHFKSQGSGIPAISTLTMGSATCDLYDCDGSGVLSDSGSDITVYNMAGAFAANTLGVAALNSAGLYVAIVEKC